MLCLFGIFATYFTKNLGPKITDVDPITSQAHNFFEMGRFCFLQSHVNCKKGRWDLLCFGEEVFQPTEEHFFLSDMREETRTMSNNLKYMCATESSL